MIFGPEMLEKVLSGEKTVTRRRSSHYVVGRVYAVQPGRGKKHVAHIRIVSVNEGWLGQVAGQEARLEGFRGWADFTDYWESLHGPIDYLETVMRIEFELALPCPRCQS